MNTEKYRSYKLIKVIIVTLLQINLFNRVGGCVCVIFYMLTQYNNTRKEFIFPDISYSDMLCFLSRNNFIEEFSFYLEKYEV